MFNIAAFDTETFLIGPGEVIPRLICLTAYFGGMDLFANIAAKEPLDGLIHDLFEDGENQPTHLVGHNVAFDLAVLARYKPSLYPHIFAMLEQSKIHDTKIREKLLNLAETGHMDELVLPDGSARKITYHLKDLVAKYLGEDITESKTANDAWRTNYSVLADLPESEWPAEAIAYAQADSQHTFSVFQEQARRAEAVEKRIGHNPLATEDFRVAVDFCLLLETAQGLLVDPQAKAALEAQIKAELAPEKLDLLIKNQILVPAQLPRPHKNGTGKMTAGTPESISKKRLESYVLLLAGKDVRIQLKYNDATERERIKAEKEGRDPVGNLCLDAGWFLDHEGLDPVLDQYGHRQKLQKLVTTELPRMEWEGMTATTVHPCFDVLKETGRTSSFAGSLYPSLNIQNVDPRARGCFVARPGHLLLSVDYSQMELGTLAQTCIDLFGHSVLADVINAGKDPHAYLGASLAYTLDNTFQRTVDERGNVQAFDDLYNFFRSYGKSEDPALVQFYDHYRKFAKPTGLGYPGGLGPETFIAYAKATYGVTCDLDTATQLREVWKSTFPEMAQYFEWVNQQRDPQHPEAFQYITPFGMYRANASYCATANGKALQSPSAEGALLGLFRMVREIFDPTHGSVLYALTGDVKPLGFIHDEHLLEIREDEHLWARIDRIKEIMISSMRVITPDVRAGAEAVLMRRWSKFAKPKFDEQGRLAVWEPEV